MSLHRFKELSLLLCLVIITGSCGNPSQIQTEIGTAVALTVQAQESLTDDSVLPTLTLVPTPQFTSTPDVDSANTPESAPASNPGCIASALLVGESPPDKTKFLPAEYFYKTWTFLNTGTCIWDTSYNLIFRDGELMGGLISYPLTEVVEPEETFNISIYLQAPPTEGIFTGYWRLRTPWGEDFGVGPQNISFYVEIETSTKKKYEVTDVEYELGRNPETGCPLNVRYTVYATVISNGPTDFDYRWDQSDGNESAIKHYEIDKAGTATFKREWLISLNDSPNPRWIQFIIMSPTYREFDKVIIDHDCFHN